MKLFLLSIPVFFLSLFAYTRLAGPIPFTVTNITTNKSDSFTVSGTGKASAIPDIATTSVGVQTQGATAKDAQNELNTKINAISAAIKKLGIDAKDIQTSGYSVNPKYNYTNNKQTIDGYQAYSTVTIKIKDMDKANLVLDEATKQGATNISGISFDVADKEKSTNEARTIAVADAKKKAVDAAKIAGFSLGKIINYTESIGGQPYPVNMMRASTAGVAENVNTNVEVGSKEISITVNLSYEVK